MSNTLAIKLSLNAVSSYNTVGVDSIKFEFPLDSVDFSREGNALVISSNDGSGAQALLNNYFAENENNTLPSLELQDGTIVNGIDFLTDYEIDTAASPSASTNGLNSYSDTAGELISGVDKLGALRGENISTSSVTSTSSPLLVAASAGSETEEPSLLPDQEITGHDGDERFVFQPDVAISSEITLNIYNPTSGRLDVTLLQESEYVQSYKVNSDGTVTVTLTDKGIGAVRQGDSFTFGFSTVVDGHDRNVEVIVNAPNDFISTDMDTSTGAKEPIPYEHHVMGETYSGSLVAGGSIRSDITVTTSGSDGVRNADIQGTEKTLVNITTSGSESSGISAQDDEMNRLNTLGSVTIHAEKSGIRDSGERASNIITDMDTLSVTGGTYGIESEGGGTHIASVKHISITGGKDALHSSGGSIYIMKAGDEAIDDVTITGRVYAEKGGQNSITEATTISIDGKDKEGFYADGDSSTNNIRGSVYNDDDTVYKTTTVTIHSDKSSAIYGTNNGQNIIGSAETLTATGGTYGIETAHGATSSISDVTHVAISGESDGIHTSHAGKATIQNAGDITISSTNGDAIHSEGKDSTTEINIAESIIINGSVVASAEAKNTITDAKILTVHASGKGIESNSDAETIISAVEAIDISSQEDVAIYANGESSTVQITGAKNGENSLTLHGGMVVDGDNSRIDISNINNITITTDQSPAMSAGSTGMFEGQNSIQINNTESVTLTSNSNTIENTDGGLIQINSTGDIAISSTDGDAIHGAASLKDDDSQQEAGQDPFSNASTTTLSTKGTADIEGAIYSSNGSTISVDADKVFVHATDDALLSEKGGIGIQTQGEVTVTSDDGAGIHTNGLVYSVETYGARIHSTDGKVTIKGGSYGIEAEDGGFAQVIGESLDITGGNGVAVIAKGNSFKNEGTYFPGTDVWLSSTNDMTLHGGIVATNKAGVDLKSAGGIEIEGTATGDAINSDGAYITATSSEGDTLIHGRVAVSNEGKVELTGSSHSLTVEGKEKDALYAQEGSVTIQSYSEVSLLSDSQSAVHGSGTGTDITVDSVEKLIVEGRTYGIETADGAVTNITDVNYVEITGELRGIETSGSAQVNITSSGDVLIHGGVAADDSGENTIDTANNVTIESTSHEALSAKNDGGVNTNTITNIRGDVTLTTGEYSNAVILTEGKGSTNTISNVDGNLTIEGGGIGIKTSDGAVTEITNINHALIKGEYSAIESDGYSDVNITDVKNLTIAGEVIANDHSTNRISSSSAITVTITAHGSGGDNRKGDALTATGESSVNIIHGGSSKELGTEDHITIVGGISAEKDSVNIIETGSGHNTITLNGKIDVSESIGLEIHKGAGWNQLVLTADSLDEFMDWYGKWLDKLANDSEFATKIGIDSIDITLPEGIDAQSFAQWLNASGNQDVNNFYNLIEAFDKHGVDITYKGESIPDHQEAKSLDGASTTSLLVADVDDTNDNPSIAKVEEDQTLIRSVALAEESQTTVHAPALVGDSQATRSVEVNSSLSDEMSSSHATTLIDFTSTENIHLSDADDTVQVIGGHYSNLLDMGGGDDTLSITDTDLTGGTIFMGEGNDHLSLAGDVTLDHTSIEGGSGYDILELGKLSTLNSSDGTLDLSSLAESISGFEVIDLSGASGMLHVDINSLLELGIDSADAIQYTLSTSAQDQDFDMNSLSADNTLVIKADSNESVRFDANWHDSGATLNDGGHEYIVYTTSYDESQYFALLQTGV